MKEEYNQFLINMNKEQKGKNKFFHLFNIFFLLFFTYFSFSYIKSNFYALPELRNEKVIDIKAGSDIQTISNILKTSGVINNSTFLVLFSRYKGKENNLKAGKYLFSGDEKNISDLVLRLESGHSGIEPQKITILEGWANYEIANYLANEIKDFDREKFDELTKNLEGYLFPDTYQIPESASEEFLVELMNSNFDKKTKELFVNKTIDEISQIINMAALIEKEAGSASLEVKKEVSGILWKRIEIGMLLQVDAVFSYIKKRHVPKVYYANLEIDSPYNTYKHTGLTPTPIANPGLDSIIAAINPNETNNLYYLTGLDGKFYYSPTLAGHNNNKVHLRK